MKQFYNTKEYNIYTTIYAYMLYTIQKKNMKILIVGGNHETFSWQIRENKS